MEVCSSRARMVDSPPVAVGDKRIAGDRVVVEVDNNWARHTAQVKREKEIGRDLA